MKNIYYKVQTKGKGHYKLIFTNEIELKNTTIKKGDWLKFKCLNTFTDETGLYEFKSNISNFNGEKKKSKKVKLIVSEKFMKDFISENINSFYSLVPLFEDYFNKKEFLIYEKNISLIPIGYKNDENHLEPYFINNKNEFVIANGENKIKNGSFFSIEEDYYIKSNYWYNREIYKFLNNGLLKIDEKIKLNNCCFNGKEIFYINESKMYICDKNKTNKNYKIELLPDLKTMECTIYEDSKLIKKFESKLLRPLKKEDWYLNLSDVNIEKESFVKIKTKSGCKVFYLSEKENKFTYLGNFKTSELKLRENRLNNKNFIFLNSNNTNCLKNISFYKGKKYKDINYSISITLKDDKINTKKQNKLENKFSFFITEKDNNILFNDILYDSMLLKSLKIDNIVDGYIVHCCCQTDKLLICYLIKNNNVFEVIDLKTKKVINIGIFKIGDDEYLSRRDEAEIINNIKNKNLMLPAINLNKELIKIKLNWSGR